MRTGRRTRRAANAAATSLPFARPLEARITWPRELHHLLVTAAVALPLLQVRRDHVSDRLLERRLVHRLVAEADGDLARVPAVGHELGQHLFRLGRRELTRRTPSCKARRRRPGRASSLRPGWRQPRSPPAQGPGAGRHHGHGANDEIVESEVDDGHDLVGSAVTRRVAATAFALTAPASRRRRCCGRRTTPSAAHRRRCASGTTGVRSGSGK